MFIIINDVWLYCTRVRNSQLKGDPPESDQSSDHFTLLDVSPSATTTNVL